MQSLANVPPLPTPAAPSSAVASLGLSLGAPVAVPAAFLAGRGCEGGAANGSGSVERKPGPAAGREGGGQAGACSGPRGSDVTDDRKTGVATCSRQSRRGSTLPEESRCDAPIASARDLADLAARPFGHYSEAASERGGSCW